MLWLLLALNPAAAADREPLREQLRTAYVDVMQLYSRASFSEAHEDALEARKLAQKLPKHDPVRLRAELTVGDTLFGLNRFDEAAVAYQHIVDRTERPKSFDHVLLLIEAASSLGATQELRGDLQDARAWHEAAWQLLQQYEVYTPLRFLVADQFAQTAIAQADYEGARTLREWVVTSLVHEQGPESPEVAQALVELASVYRFLDAWSEAEAVLLQARSIFVAMPDPGLNLAETDRRLADLYAASAQVSEAREALARASEGYHAVFEAGDPQLQNLLSTTSNVAVLLGDLQGALDSRRQVLALMTAAVGPDHPQVLMTRAAIADLIVQNGSFEEADVELTALLPLLEKALGPNHPDVAGVRAQRARVWAELGRYSAAVTELRGALTLLESDPGSVALVPGLTGSLALLLQEAGDPSASEATYLQALELAHRASPQEQANLHNAYGALLLEVGRLQEAEYRFRLALQGLEQTLGPNHPDLSGALNNLALVLQQRGDLLAAQPLYERSLAIERAAFGDDHLQLAGIQHNLGILHLVRGDLDGAKRWLERSLAIKERDLGALHPSLAVTLDKLAVVLELQGDPAGAEALLRRSLAIRETLGPEHPDLGFGLDHLAHLLLNQQRYDEAQPLLERSLALTRRLYGPGAPRSFATQVALAFLELGRGHGAEALAELRSLLAALPTELAEDHPERLNLESTIGLLAYLEGDVQGARTLLAEVLEREEHGLKRLLGSLSERERLALTRDHRQTLFYFLQAHEIEGGDPQAAYAALLRFKGLGSRSLAVEQPALLALADPTTYARWSEVKRRLGDLVLAGDPASGPELAALSEEKEALRRTLAAASAEGRAAIEQIRPTDLCALLPAGTTLVDFVRRSTGKEGGGSHDVYTAFVLASGCTTVSRVELGEAATLDQAIDQHRSLLASRAPTIRIDRAGKKLRERAWDPIRPFLEDAAQVYIVPDSALSTVSFASLPTDEGYLVERIGLRILDAAVDARPRQAAVDRGSLVLGGVDYGTVADADDGIRAACVSNFPALPATGLEATAVSTLLQRAGPVRTLRGEEATQQALEQGLTQASTVHLATHGFFATGACRASLGASEDVVGMNPLLLSGVALAGANDDSAAIWTAEEISTLPLGGVDLVVLSACETGLGAIADGEGVQGLRRAFALSGNRATVMSLWPVDDAATQTLMGSFYQALLADPLRDEQAALRTAQRALLAHNLAELGEARPETWAAFVVAGSPRATAP